MWWSIDNLSFCCSADLHVVRWKFIEQRNQLLESKSMISQHFELFISAYNNNDCGHDCGSSCCASTFDILSDLTDLSKKKQHNIHQQKQRQKIRKWLKQTIFAENYIISSKLAVVTSKWVFIFVLFALVDFFSDQLQLCPEGLRILKLMW